MGHSFPLSPFCQSMGNAAKGLFTQLAPPLQRREIHELLPNLEGRQATPFLWDPALHGHAPFRTTTIRGQI